MPVDKIRYFPPLGCGITQKGGGEYFEDYPTFVYKADVGGFHQKKSVYIATWVKTAFVTQCCIDDDAKGDNDGDDHGDNADDEDQ